MHWSGDEEIQVYLAAREGRAEMADANFDAIQRKCSEYNYDTATGPPNIGGSELAGILSFIAGHNNISRERIRDLEAENARLRELHIEATRRHSNLAAVYIPLRATEHRLRYALEQIETIGEYEGAEWVKSEARAALAPEQEPMAQGYADLSADGGLPEVPREPTDSEVLDFIFRHYPIPGEDFVTFPNRKSVLAAMAEEEKS